MNQEQDQQLSVTTEDGVILKLCLHLLLLFRDDVHLSKRKIFIDILDEHNTLTGNKYRWTTNPKTGKLKRLKNGINSYIQPRDWLPEAKDTVWFLTYHAGEQASDASDIEVHTCLAGWGAVSLSIIHAQFPVDQFDGQSSGLPELAQKWCAMLQPEHGYGGFRLAESHGYEDSEGAFHCRLLSQRFWGLDIGHALLHDDLTRSIKGVDWLTILSTPFVDQLGGEATVRQAMGALPVLSYPGGLILQTGTMPQVGDMQRQEDMSAYFQVAKIVEPIRCKDHKGGYC